MNRFTRIFALALVAALCLALAACGAPAASESTAAALTAEDYANIIKDSRPAEDNDYVEIAAGKGADEMKMVNNPYEVDEETAKDTITMMLEMMGMDTANLDNYAFSMSMMNTQAYLMGIFKPAEGKEADIQASVDAVVAQLQKSFENYLADQYEIAKAAIVKTMPNGEIVVVMCENAGDVMNKIEAAL